MSDLTSASAVQSSYTVGTTVQTATTSNIELKIASVEGTRVLYEFWGDLEPDKAVQVDTLAVSGDVTVGDTCTITIVDEDTNTGIYRAEATAGDTFESYLQKVLAAINIDDDVFASVTASDVGAFTATIEIRSSTGKSYTATIVDTGTFTVADPVSVAVGDPYADLKRRKLADVVVEGRIGEDGIPQVVSRTQFFDAAETNPIVVSEIAELASNHPSSLALLLNPVT